MRKRGQALSQNPARVRRVLKGQENRPAKQNQARLRHQALPVARRVPNRALNSPFGVFHVKHLDVNEMFHVKHVWFCVDAPLVDAEINTTSRAGLVYVC